MLSCHFISLRVGSLPCDGCDGCPTEASVCSAVGPDPVRHEVRRSPPGGPRHAQESHIVPEERARRATLHGDADAPVRDRDSPLWICRFVYTVLDVGSMIAIDCGAMQMGIVGSGAVCYRCMRALLSLLSLSPSLLNSSISGSTSGPGLGACIS